jgi:hypothetical protein
MKKIDHIALEAEAALAATFWCSLLADYEARNANQAAITMRHMTTCMERIEKILDGDSSASYPLPCNYTGGTL